MKLNTAQRVLIVVAYGLALWVVWGWVSIEGWRQFSNDGSWFNYAPNSGVTFSPGISEFRTNLTLRASVELAIVALWLVPSAWLLRDRVRAVASSDPRVEDDDADSDTAGRL